jgi:hypothetical protein
MSNVIKLPVPQRVPGTMGVKEWATEVAETLGDCGGSSRAEDSFLRAVHHLLRQTAEEEGYGDFQLPADTAEKIKRSQALWWEVISDAFDAAGVSDFDGCALNTLWWLIGGIYQVGTVLTRRGRGA